MKQEGSLYKIKILNLRLIFPQLHDLPPSFDSLNLSPIGICGILMFDILSLSLLVKLIRSEGLGKWISADGDLLYCLPVIAVEWNGNLLSCIRMEAGQ